VVINDLMQNGYFIRRHVARAATAGCELMEFETIVTDCRPRSFPRHLG
jgi:hypothetical protein